MSIYKFLLNWCVSSSTSCSADECSAGVGVDRGGAADHRIDWVFLKCKSCFDYIKSPFAIGNLLNIYKLDKK